MDLSSRHCFNHPEREAAVICPECRKFFCRECVTEYDDRMLCADCLLKIIKSPLAERLRLRHVKRIGVCLLGILTAWLFFYALGQALLSIPTPFHEGTVWKQSKNK